ncbi:MAG: PAS domain-containing protein [Hyphomicrobiales bacterium]|nr:PAS domain-containing protein [Hyphomicrobiales bacterium]MDE2016176.1 PAS domain-containing protein [Hyphomicrobiales bacterium]
MNAAAPVSPEAGAAAALAALPHPVVTVAADGRFLSANLAAEQFFGLGAAALLRARLADFLPAGSPALSIVAAVMSGGAAINEYRVDVAAPRLGPDRLLDVHVAPLVDGRGVVVMLQERTIAEKMDRQLVHRGAARSVAALAAMLAHEIKNPLSGIRGAAQLLESAVEEDDRALTRLICDETDRIVKLVDRMDEFSDAGPPKLEPVNVHSVLDHVKRVGKAGFARHLRVVETYDPSLPDVMGDRDALVQAFLNLMKNAAEAIGPDAVDGEIEFTTAYRPGVRLKTSVGARPVGLPLEICVRDNGPGVPPDLAPVIFDPFVTSKPSGTGLGLALVAKVVRDHGGVVECESQPRRTTFRALLPIPGAASEKAR